MSTLAEISKTIESAPAEFLHLLRAINVLQHANAAEVVAIKAEIERLDALSGGLRRARELSLISDTPGGIAVSALGRQICDGVKQYCNWLDHADHLPRGVTSEMIRGKCVLDVGCGVGCAMLTFLRHGAAVVAGIDMIESSLVLCRAFCAREGVELPLLARADGADLPFATNAFDMVFSRLALNYMRSDSALGSIARVSRGDATLVVCLNTLPWHLEQIRKQLRRLQLKSASFGLFTLLNGMLYHTLGRQLTLRHRGSMHSVHSPIFHTPRTLRRDLSRWGFDTLTDDSAQYRQTPTFLAVRRSG